MTEHQTEFSASINGEGHHDHDGHNHDDENGRSAHGHNHDHSHDHAHSHNKEQNHPHKHGDEEGHAHEKHEHHDHHDHEDETGNKDTLKKLYIATGVSIFFIGAQFTGGLLANSIAIMLDTAHLATDVLGFGIAIMAIKLAERQAVHTMSFGYHRAEIIGTLLSLAFLWGITIYLLFAAYARLLNPPEIHENIMLITAVAGLIFNIIQMTILDAHDHVHGHSHDHGHGHSHGGHSHGNQEPLLEGEKKKSTNINLDGAKLHVLGDLLNSIGVIIAAVIIWFWPEAKIADPLITFIFTIIIIATSYPAVKKCLLTLMEATPADVDYFKVEESIKKCEGVE